MATQLFNATVTINGVDKTAKLTGAVEIDQEEATARTAFFTLLPDAGITDLITWVNANVVIKSVVNGATVTEFTGVIDTPNFNIQTGITRFSCTDNMQEHFETKTLAQIDAIALGYRSEAVFNDSIGWEYASERFSTVPSSTEFDENLILRTTLWAAKATPDFTFTESDIIDKSLAVSSIANRRNIINAVDIELKYRYLRLKERQQFYDWVDPYSVCGQQYDANVSRAYPLKSRVKNSVENTTWELIGSLILSDLPASGLYVCAPDPDVAFITNDLLCDGATFTLGKRYSQNVTETYNLRIESQDSISALGEIAIKQNANLQTDYNKDKWEKALIADGYTDFGTPLTDPAGHVYINADDAQGRQDALDTAINLAKTKILSSHRNNKITFDLPIEQAINLTHTIQINTTNFTAKGKVSRVVRKINSDTNQATTQVTISLSKKIGTGIAGTPIAPSIPPALPAAPDAQTVDVNLLTHAGGRDATLFDPNWSGWIVDYKFITEVGYIPYPKGFVIHTPAITLNSVDNIIATDNSLTNVVIPDDLMQ